MGYRLEGPKLEHRDVVSQQIISDGNALGSIQVPPDELPIVMLADRATTGGYPKIATVVSADVARLAQLMPGERLRFKAVSLEEVQGR
jgi:allophanate hydrolase subunit 2